MEHDFVPDAATWTILLEGNGTKLVHKKFEIVASQKCGKKQKRCSAKPLR